MNFITKSLIATYLVTLLLAIMLAGCDKPTKVPDLSKLPLCAEYTRLGRPVVDAAWSSDLPKFAPLFAMPVDPEADEAFCRGVIAKHGAAILTKADGQSHSTSLAFVVLLSPKFADYSPSHRAATMCHEAMHIVWQSRVGPARAGVEYLTVSGRMASEAVAYALGDAIYRRHGKTDEWLDGQRESRAKRFPKTYKLEKLVSAECVLDILGGVSDELKAVVWR